MSAPPRGGERGGRGTRGGRGGRGRGASSLEAQSSAAGDHAPVSETQSGGDKPVAATRASRTDGPVIPAILRSSAPATASSSRGTTSRFKPKNIRRDEAERKKLEDDRNRDLAIKVKAEERELRAEERRARRGRGRGNAPRGGLTRRGVAAGGPFSGGADNIKTDGGDVRKGFFGFGSDNSLRYRPRREHEARINTDLLNSLSDGQDSDGTPLYQPVRYAQKSGGTIPIGMHRTLYQEPEVKVKTQAELEAEDRQSSDDEGDLFVADPGPDIRKLSLNNDNEVWHAAPKPKSAVKTEPGTEGEGGDIDMADIPEAPKSASDAAIEKMQKRKEKKMAEDPEYMQSELDAEALLRTLSLNQPGEDGEGQEKDDQLFVIQFPPILPPLVRPSGKKDGAEDDMDESEAGAGVKVKLEDDAEATQPKNMGLPAEGGFIGRLNVRKSGKVELDWGGITLNLGLATDTDFLTTAMILEQKENVETAEESAGVAYGMGQVFGKFVVSLPCEEEEEWDPNIDDIMREAHMGLEH